MARVVEGIARELPPIRRIPEGAVDAHFSWSGDEGNVQPVYLGLGRDTDFFIGIDFEDRPAFVQPLSPVGRGFEFTSAKLAAVFATIERRDITSRFAALLV